VATAPCRSANPGSPHMDQCDGSSRRTGAFGGRPPTAMKNFAALQRGSWRRQSVSAAGSGSPDYRAIRPSIASSTASSCARPLRSQPPMGGPEEGARGQRRVERKSFNRPSGMSIPVNRNRGDRDPAENTPSAKTPVVMEAVSTCSSEKDRTLHSGWPTSNVNGGQHRIATMIEKGVVPAQHTMLAQDYC